MSKKQQQHHQHTQKRQLFDSCTQSNFFLKYFNLLAYECVDPYSAPYSFLHMYLQLPFLKWNPSKWCVRLLCVFLYNLLVSLLLFKFILAFLSLFPFLFSYSRTYVYEIISHISLLTHYIVCARKNKKGRNFMVWAQHKLIFFCEQMMEAD